MKIGRNVEAKDTHRIFLCKLFTGGFVDKYNDNIILGKFSCKFTCINPTGIPTHLVSTYNLECGIGNRIHMLENNLGKQLISLRHGIDELRGRNINTINTKTIINTR